MTTMTNAVCGARNPDNGTQCDFRKGHKPILDDDAEIWDHGMRYEGQLSSAWNGDADDPGSDIEVLIENIAAGKADPHLEAILAAAHGRKRALRNVDNPYGRRNVR